jgi:gliding motility-associated-like protein
VSIPVTITVNISGPVLDLGENMVICEGEWATITPEGAFTSYLWHDGSTAGEFIADQEGWIILRVTDIVGCATADSLFLSVAKLPVVYLGPDTTVCTEEGIILDAGTDGEQYLWSTGAVSRQITVYNDGNQEIWAEVQNAFGCTGSDTVLVRACDLSHLIDLPTGITPNDDGVNDVWNIRALDQFPDAVVEVYDQWGTLVWRSEPGYPTPWDGRNMRGNQVPFDSYHFVIHFNDGTDERYVGFITVMH